MGQSSEVGTGSVFRSCRQTGSGQLSDVQLADLWLNSDALHTRQIQSGVGKDMSLNERYKAAVGVYSRIGA
jgi:hypothetical protein